jgi:hypothetical protein
MTNEADPLLIAAAAYAYARNKAEKQADTASSGYMAAVTQMNTAAAAIRARGLDPVDVTEWVENGQAQGYWAVASWVRS